MPFKSLKQAYWLYKNKPKAFRQIAGVYGVPKGWHDYKQERENVRNVQKSWKQILKDERQGPKTKAEVLIEHGKRAELVREMSDIYDMQVNENPLVAKPKWSGALSSLNDLRNGYRIQSNADIADALTKTEKIQFTLNIDGHVDQGYEKISTLVIKADLQMWAEQESGKWIKITPVKISTHDSIKDFVEIYNKPGHKYKNIEAKLRYRTENTYDTDLHIRIHDLLSFDFRPSGSHIFEYKVNNLNRVVLNHHTWGVFKRLKGIQLKPRSHRG